ncbi:MAG: glycosyltransferase family 9 protein [Chloroflexia bacterium]|nr:glycosyltransferase family 9 protein [Chloroflexia bacterium]
MRIGTSHRWSHFLYCNKRVNFGRKRSYLHEAQLNIKLLKPLIEKTEFSLSEIEGFYGFSKVKELPEKHKQLLHKDKFNLILHPKSKGSAREWGEDNFTKLINILPKDKYNIFITGTKDEGTLLRDFLNENKDKIIDLTGKLSLTELISFINEADGLVAASTGPLHIAASLNRIVVGIYAPIRPMHPGRWAPVGKNASYLVLDKKCDDCRRTMDCKCIREIEAFDVFKKLENHRKNG